MRKATDHFSALYHDLSGFQELGIVINYSLMVSNFENGWEEMLKRYKLQKNKHLKTMFEKRTD
jgi:hypothetical protein